MHPEPRRSDGRVGAGYPRAHDHADRALATGEAHSNPVPIDAVRSPPLNLMRVREPRTEESRDKEPSLAIPRARRPEMVTQLTCPHCGHESQEVVPIDACVILHVCAECGLDVRPLRGDCCVFCSYGTDPCPTSPRRVTEGERHCC